MTEQQLPELADLTVDYRCGGKLTREKGRLLGAAAMILETDRRDPVDAEVELKFRPKPDSPEVVARGVVGAHLSDGRLRVQFTELAEEHRRHLLELLYPPGIDRRTARRVSLVTQIRTVVGGRTLVGYTRDISAGGVFVESENPAPKGTEVTLRFRLTPDAPIVEVQALVVYSLEGEGMGLKFMGVPAEVGETIENFVVGK